MTTGRFLRSGGILATLLILALPMARPAGASERGTLALSEEPTTAEHGPLIGVRPEPTPARPDECRTVGPCDVFAIDVAGDAGAVSDLLLEVDIAWDGADGNVLNAALFDDRVVDDAADPGRNEIPGMLKWTSGDRGSLTLRYANPVPGRYSITVINATGLNQGYRITGRLRPPASVTNDPPPPPGAPVVPTPGPVDGADSDDGRSTIADTDAERTAADRQPAPGVDRAREVSAGPPVSTVSAVAGGAGWWLALILAGLLLVAFASRRFHLVEIVGHRFADLRLFWKLMLPFVVVVLAVGVIGTYATSRFLADQEASDVARRLVQGNSTASGYLRDQEFTLLDSVRFAANVQGVPEALAASDSALAEQSLASVASVNEGLDVIAAVGPDGKALASLVRRDGTVTAHAGEDWGTLPIVRSVLDGEVDVTGDKRAALIRLSDGTPVLVVASPARTSEIVGAVIVGRRLGPIVNEAAERSDASVAVYDPRGDRLSSSDGVLPEVVDPRDQTGRAGPATGLDGNEFTRSIAPLTLRDQTVGAIAVAVPSGAGSDEARAAALRLAVLVAIALLAITALGSLLSRSILRTVRPLLDMNRALGRGELSVRAPVHGHDELGELALGFNQMAEELEASYQQLEQRVAERTEELHRMHRARDDFYASVSHELRTPLFAILATSELLTDSQLAPTDPAERAQFLGTIHTSAEQLVVRVNEILDLARASASEVELVLADVDLGPLFDHATKTVQALARPNGLEVHSHRADGLPSIQADRDRLLQILLNLGSNAVKYTPAGGEIVMRAESRDDVIVLSVSDTGVGIPDEVGDQIFEPYYVVDPERRGTQPSTGLGLFVTRRLVEAHGGTIRYHSTAVGTTFEVEMPRRARAVPPDSIAADPETPVSADRTDTSPDQLHH